MSTKAPVETKEEETEVWEVIPDRYREEAVPFHPRKPNPTAAKLLEGATLFVPIKNANENALNKLYQVATKNGHKMKKLKTKINDREGYIMWWEKLTTQSEPDGTSKTT